MSVEVPADELRKVVERMHGGRARLREVVPVLETYREQVVWEGEVHVFDLEGHPTASVCYAWTSFIGDSDRRRFYAALGVPPINSPADAIRAAFVADRKAGRPT
jgi:hypothetical protein